MIRQAFYELERTGAIISECGRYRYALHRRLSARDRKSCLFIMLNPSTAAHTRNDPTIRRCLTFADKFGCDRLFVGNLFAWRATDPRQLRKDGVGDGDIIGPENKDWLEVMADVVTCREEIKGPIICAWGPQGRYMQQDLTVRDWLAGYTLWCLGRSKDHSPRHPLMLPKLAELVRFR